MLLLQYEKAVLEWFHAAYPKLREMIYADDIDKLLSKDAIVKYPSLIYSREDSDIVSGVPYDSYETDADGNLQRIRTFPFDQIYTAKLVTEKQSDIWAIANAIRQHWSYDSYAHVRPKGADWLLNVGMRLLSFRVESERDNLDRKGARRVLTMRWRSVLQLEDYDEAMRWLGYRIYIVPNGVEAEEWLVAQGDLPIGGVAPTVDDLKVSV